MCDAGSVTLMRGCEGKMSNEFEVPKDVVNALVRGVVPFSLCCVNCTAGEDIETPSDALIDGWIDLEVAEDGAWYNYLGVCPDCAPDYLKGQGMTDV